MSTGNIRRISEKLRRRQLQFAGRMRADEDVISSLLQCGVFPRSWRNTTTTLSSAEAPSTQKRRENGKERDNGGIKKPRARWERTKETSEKERATATTPNKTKLHRKDDDNPMLR